MSKVTIKTLREKIGTQEQVAKLLNVKQNTISNWENGTARPKTKDLQRIAKLYGVSISELIESMNEEKLNGKNK